MDLLWRPAFLVPWGQGILRFGLHRVVSKALQLMGRLVELNVLCPKSLEVAPGIQRVAAEDGRNLKSVSDQPRLSPLRGLQPVLLWMLRPEKAVKGYRRYVLENKVYRLKPAWLLGSEPIRYEITLFLLVFLLVCR